MLTYEYNAHTLVPGRGNDDQLMSLAATFISELVAERQQANALSRPLIFLCHGVGGLLVKRALAFSFSQSSATTKYLRSIYVSTYGIIFAGTPHYGMENDALSLLYPEDTLRASQFAAGLLRGSTMITDISDQFVPLMKRFRIYNFWEQLKTQFGDQSIYIVEKTSAAPDYYAEERSGILADHDGLLDFKSSDDHAYKLVFGVLVRYIGEAPTEIKGRWEGEGNLPRNAAASPLSQHQGHVFEQNVISGGKVHFGDIYCHSTKHTEESPGVAKNVSRREKELFSPVETDVASLNELYIVPRCSSPQFVGRQLLANMVEENLMSAAGQVDGCKHRIVVIYGIGGSGKTQFCLRYAESNQSR